MSDKTTNWFSGYVKPVRKGYYECKEAKPFFGGVNQTQFDYWNGSNWCRYKGCKPYSKETQSTFKWRGLIRPTV